MKKTVFIIAALAAVLVSCEKNDKVDAPIQPKQGEYVGVVTVTYQGADYDNKDISVDFAPNEKGDSASVTIHQIRFVPQMPVTIDITIPGIAVNSTDDKIALKCDSVIPQAMGGEVPRYKVTGLKGEIVDDELSFSLNFGSYPTSFRGTRISSNQPKN